MLNDRYQRVGSIMFDDADDKPFPTLDDLLGGSYEGRPDELAHFLVVASDPARLRYFDDDSEATDTTNFAVLKDALDEPAYVPGYRAMDPATEETVLGAALERGAAIYHGDTETLLLVDPEALETVSDFEVLRACLLNYPLLDESAYSEREADAWNEFLHGGLRTDTLRDLQEQGIDEDMIDAIDNAWDTIAPKAAEKLDWYHGFTGEHSPDFVELIGKTLVDALGQVPTAMFGPPGTGDDPGSCDAAGGGGVRARLEAYRSLDAASPATGTLATPVDDGLGSWATRGLL